LRQLFAVAAVERCKGMQELQQYATLFAKFFLICNNNVRFFADNQGVARQKKNVSK
jgi:hypothetical protein